MPAEKATPETEAEKVTDVDSAANALLGLMEPERQPDKKPDEKEAPKADAKPDKKDGDTQKPEDTEEEDKEISDEKDDEEQADEAEVKGKQDTDKDETKDESEEMLPGSVNELAEAFGIDADDLRKQLRDTIVVDGEKSELSLHEIRRGHLRESDYTRKTQELAEQRKALEAERDAKQSALEQQAGRLTGLIWSWKNH